MMKILFSLSTLLFSLVLVAQPPANAPLPKDAPVDVNVLEMRTKAPRNNELIVFQSQKNGNQFQGITDSLGKFSLRLPSGDKYEIYIMGFKDSISYSILDIPALAANAYYKKAQVVTIEFDPPKSFVLDNVQFATGKADLKPESFIALDELVEYLRRKDDERIEIGGHTDNVGTRPKNLILSMNRAKSVMAYLIAKGIPSERLTAQGYADTEPVDDNTTAEGRQRNRRTEVKIL